MEYIRIKGDLLINACEFKSLRIEKSGYNYSIILTYANNIEKALFSWESYDFVYKVYEEFINELLSDYKVKNLKTDGLIERAKEYTKTYKENDSGVQAYYYYN